MSLPVNDQGNWIIKFDIVGISQNLPIFNHCSVGIGLNIFIKEDYNIVLN